MAHGLDYGDSTLKLLLGHDGAGEDGEYENPALKTLRWGIQTIARNK